MDAAALLKSQGWRGAGHSLHPDSDDTGLKHHLLIKRNDDGSGLGLKKSDHKAAAWWLNAFDQALKGIDVNGENGKGGMSSTLKGGGELGRITKKGLSKYTGSRGLYCSFVKGGIMGGTVGVLGVADGKGVKAGLTMGAGEDGNKKKKTKAKQLMTPPASGAATPMSNEEEGSGSDESEGEKDKKRSRSKDAKSEKEARRKEKAERRLRREGKRAKKAAKEKERSGGSGDERKALRKEAKKAEKRKAKVELKASETREQRKARRDLRRKRKEVKRKDVKTER